MDESSIVKKDYVIVKSGRRYVVRVESYLHSGIVTVTDLSRSVLLGITFSSGFNDGTYVFSLVDLFCSH
jgi:hypothetical protein